MKLHSEQLPAIDAIRNFLAGASALGFKVFSRNEAYHWIESSHANGLNFVRSDLTMRDNLYDYIIVGAGPAVLVRPGRYKRLQYRLRADHQRLQYCQRYTPHTRYTAYRYLLKKINKILFVFLTGDFN